MLYAYVRIFDVIGIIENFWELNRAIVDVLIMLQKTKNSKCPNLHSSFQSHTPTACNTKGATNRNDPFTSFSIPSISIIRTADFSFAHWNESFKYMCVRQMKLTNKLRNSRLQKAKLVHGRFNNKKMETTHYN